ncbi:hypothetical protein BpHYR1_017137 [Brachionus plicatilis]|uniref:Uncharacterized protein n=1 Tax=Brachionus plicatilis TaxID=10195 RepID=A0A3M7S519_BRAPC|nr:hypothetical protein BpHYR1_017137 [Brachionus plicatilis]
MYNKLHIAVWLIDFDISAFRAGQLSPNFIADLMMSMLLDELEQGLLLLAGHVRFVALHKGQQRLVPQHRQLSALTHKSRKFLLRIFSPCQWSNLLNKVVDNGIHHPVRQSVLLVQENADKNRIGARVLHLGNFEQSSGRVEHGNGAFGHYAADDDGLSERTIPGLAQRQQDALEKGGRLKQRFLQRHVQVKVEPLVFVDVVADARQQHQTVEPLGHFGVQVGREYPGRLVDSSRGPDIRLGDVQYVLPVGQ